jgi:nucleotide-binding universal stress UspA family protein
MAGSMICGVDDSKSARGAARVARALASELGLALVFVRVVERDAPDAEISAVAERLETLSAGANELDCGAAWLVDVGQPAEQLVDIAAKAGAALIVMGSGRSRSSARASVSAEVSRRARCPVLVVPPGAGSLSGTDHAAATERSAVVSVKEQKRIDGPKTRDFAGGIVRFGLDGRHSGVSAVTPSEADRGLREAKGS